MNTFVILLSCLLAIACGAPADEGRIVGGKNAELGQFPYQVSLRSNGRHFCGGTIVTPNTIVTAAHCNIGSIKSMTVWTGTVTLNSGGDEYAASKFIEHPGWNPYNLENDIGVIILETPIQMNENVSAIDYADVDVADDVSVVTSGWGYTTYPGSAPNRLQWIDLQTITAKKCQSLHNGELHASQICTLTKAGEGVCSGDSGGPLVKDNKLVGVTSAAYLCALGRPDFFTRVHFFNSWLKENVV